MKKLSPQMKLQESILLLETKQANDMAILKAEFKTTIESFKPINIIKHSIDGFIHSPHLRENVLDASLSLVAGYLTKKLTFGNTHNPIKQIVGNLVQIGVTNVVSKNVDGIRSFATRMITKFSNRKANKNS